MKLQILPGLPGSHKWKSLKIKDRQYRGIVWDQNDILSENKMYLYKNWARVHFESDWYEPCVSKITSNKNTKRDIGILKKLLGKNLDSTSFIIDVNCGSGRHVFAFKKLGLNIMGMEGARLLKEAAIEKAKGNSILVDFVSTNLCFQKKYRHKTDIVTSMFNAMGYTFNQAEDMERLKWTIDLLKPGGYLVLDIRSAEYQKEHYKRPTTIVEKFLLNTSLSNFKATVITKKFWTKSILGAEEKIIIKIKGEEIVVQHTTYGWKTYSLAKLKRMLKKLRVNVIKLKRSYYENPSKNGERLFIIARVKN